MAQKFSWTDIDDIACTLAEVHRGVDPVAIPFPELRTMVEALDDFEEEPGHPVNEQILEAIQHAWLEERADLEDDDDDPGYSSPQPYGPDKS